MAVPETSASVLLRMSPEQRQQLADEAAKSGVTVRALLMYRVFGITLDPPKPGRKPSTQAPLPLNNGRASA